VVVARGAKGSGTTRPGRSSENGKGGPRVRRRTGVPCAEDPRGHERDGRSGEVADDLDELRGRSAEARHDCRTADKHCRRIVVVGLPKMLLVVPADPPTPSRTESVSAGSGNH